MYQEKRSLPVEALQSIPIGALEAIAGGTFLDGVYNLYKNIVAYPTAAFGGWQLASQVYGSRATLGDRWRGMGHVKSFVDGSSEVPAWARFW